MLRRRLERATEAYRHADADQQAAEHHRTEVLRETEQQDARGGHKHHRGCHAPRAKAVQQHADRDLRAGKAEEIHAGQRAEVTRR